MKDLYPIGKFTLAIFLVFFISPIVSIGYLPKAFILENILKTSYASDIQRNIFIDDAVADFPQIASKDKTVFQLVTHGRPGELFISGNWLNASQIAVFIKQRVGEHSRVFYLNIYGCNFAKGRKGKEAVLFLEDNLKMHVAASSNVTGRGGDWTLEVGIPKNVLHPSYSHSLQSNCYTAGTNQGNIYINYYCLGPSPAVSESTSFSVAPNFSGVDPSSGYPTNPNPPTSPHSGATEAANNAGFNGYTSSSTAELYIIDIFISKKAMDCALGFTTGHYEFRMKVTGFSRQVLFVDTTGSNSSINGDWRSRQVQTGSGANPLYTDTISIQASNPTDWIFTKNYTIDATLNSLYIIEYRHSSQSTFSSVPSAWVYPAVVNNDICLKDSFPTNLTSSNGDTICPGQSTVLSANCSLSGSTLVWYTNSSLTSPLGTSTASPSTPTTYYAVCEQNGCKSRSDSIKVVPSGPATPVVSNSNVSNVCPSSTVNLITLTTASSGITYEWHSANNTNSSSIVASPTAVGVGSYYVFAKNAGNCYSPNAANVSVTINSCSSPDTITAMLNCASCSFTGCPTANNLPAGPRTYSSCSTPVGFTAGSSDGQGCITYTSTSPGADTAKTCVVACSGGVCDTTFFSIIKSIVLPVTVTDFSGKTNKNGINTLSRVVAGEDAIRDYAIESSQNQRDWKTIGKKQARGEKSTLAYSITDQTPSGQDFYRLKIFEENGNVQIFPKVVYLKGELPFIEEMRIYPNPAQTILNVQYLNPINNTTLQLTICDIMGKEVYKLAHKLTVGSNIFSLDIDKLEHGIYILHYNNIQDGTNGKIKFVKETN
jgi:hypothetical protein